MNSLLNTEESWNTYCMREIALLTPILSKYGYTLDTEQPHTKGERFLMQAITTTSGKKLILLGRNTDGIRVVIKATRDEAGIRELTHEHLCRDVLEKIDFAASVFHSPEEVAYLHESGFVVAITRYVEQTSTFLDRRIEEQYARALSAFKGQESAHATTFNHRALITDTFGIRTVETYLLMFSSFLENVIQTLHEEKELHERLKAALELLTRNKISIEQYCSFLTHTDFVPHNIRIEGDTMYLLDHSSLTFGNKYEGWARFLNFMTLYNPPLERALTAYVRENRTPEESVSLRMMRIYRLGEIIWYYIRTLDASSGDLLQLNRARIFFWSDVLASILKDEAVPTSLVEGYKAKRDSLRSEDEKKRQQGLH